MQDNFRRVNGPENIDSLLVGSGVLPGHMLQHQGTQFFTQTSWSAWIAAYLVYFLYHCCRADATQAALNSRHALRSTMLNARSLASGVL